MKALTKEPSIIEQKAYRDTWGHGIDSYLQWFYETIVLLRELLSEDGCIYVHCDWRLSRYVGNVLTEVFGGDAFRNEIIWKRTSIVDGVDLIIHNSAENMIPFTTFQNQLNDGNTR